MKIMRSNTSRLLQEFKEFQRRNCAPSHYRHLAINRIMVSSPLFDPGAHIVGVANGWHNTERCADEGSGHFGNLS